MGNKNSGAPPAGGGGDGGSNNERNPKRTKSQRRKSSTSKDGEKVGKYVAKGDKEDAAVVEAILIADEVDEAEAKREQGEQGATDAWARDELYSPAWLIAHVRRHEVVRNPRTLDLLIQNEYDVHLLKRYGEDGLKQVGVDDQDDIENLIKFASNL